MYHWWSNPAFWIWFFAVGTAVMAVLGKIQVFRRQQIGFYVISAGCLAALTMIVSVQRYGFRGGLAVLLVVSLIACAPSFWRNLNRDLSETQEVPETPPVRQP